MRMREARTAEAPDVGACAWLGTYPVVRTPGGQASSHNLPARERSFSPTAALFDEEQCAARRFRRTLGHCNSSGDRMVSALSRQRPRRWGRPHWLRLLICLALLVFSAPFGDAHGPVLAFSPALSDMETSGQALTAAKADRAAHACPDAEQHTSHAVCPGSGACHATVIGANVAVGPRATICTLEPIASAVSRGGDVPPLIHPPRRQTDA